MKKFSLFSLALAGLMLGACSNELDVNGGENSDVLPGETGYVSLSVNLPTTEGVRALDYEDGTANEYDVKNAKLLIFAGSDEASATCSGIYDLEISAFLDNPSNQVTSTAQLVQAVTRPTSGNIYALIVLNDNGLITESMKGTAFSTFYTTAKDLNVSAVSGVNGFFMTNAPLYSIAGGTSNPVGGTVSTLSLIDPDKIYTTENEALNSPATTVYVERILSKVTLEGSSDLSSGHNANITSYEINGWTLDNTNKSTYLVRNVSPTSAWWAYQNSTNGYRFVDGTPVKSGVALYRTHFAMDPNYNVSYNSANFNSISKNPTGLTAADGESPVYCLENTFNVANMTEQNTTRAIIAAKLTVTGAEETEGDFYLLNKNTNVVYQNAGVLKEVKRLWMNHLDEIIDTYVKSGSFTDENVTVTLGELKNGGVVSVAGIAMSEGTGIVYQDGKSLSDLNAEATNFVATVNGALEISYYKGGVAYYPVLIKHFGDAETPWQTTNIQNGNSYPGPNAENNWLGRYGVVRNTWYQLNVTGLKNIGFAEVPEVTEEYDDPGKEYISVEINILPWAVRTQNVEL